MVTFTHGGYAVRMRVAYKPVDGDAVRAKAKRARSKTAAQLEFELNEQEAKRIWRVMEWSLKARLVAVDEGLESLVEAFLAHIVNPDTGETVYEQLTRTGTVEFGKPLLEIEAGRV